MGAGLPAPVKNHVHCRALVLRMFPTRHAGRYSVRLRDCGAMMILRRSLWLGVGLSVVMVPTNLFWLLLAMLGGLCACLLP